jgi:hypothetical protein
MMDYRLIIYLSIITLALIKANDDTNNISGLFGKDEKPDKLVIKNQIAYHFKRLVKNVDQELFVSRKMDVSLLFQGILVLKKTEKEVRHMCDNLPSKMQTFGVKAPEILIPFKEPYHIIMDPYHLSFKEAKARCIAMGMQLPEVYTDDEKERLTAFMLKNAVIKCHAGIEIDLTDSIQRHIATQYPIWNTAYDELYLASTGKPVELQWFIDNSNARFVYTHNGTLVIS